MRSHFLIPIIFLISSPLNAETTRCIKTPADKYDVGHVMLASRYQGQCADTSTKRPAQIIAESDSQLTFANVRHDGRWWIAKLPKKAVVKVILAVKELSLPPLIHGAHSELRFVLKPRSEMQLTAITHENGKPDIDLLDDVMWSMEYVAPEGVDYSAFVGITESYDSVDRIVSTKDRALEQLKSHRHPTEQWLLEFPHPEDADLLLQKAIHQSQNKGFSQVYYTLKQNCNSALFNLLDLMPDKETGVPPYEIQWTRFFSSIETQFSEDLLSRGLIHTHNEQPNLPTVEEELLGKGIIQRSE